MLYPVQSGPEPKRLTRAIYPFSSMLVDQWFVAPRDMGTTDKSVDKRHRAIIGAANAWRKHNKRLDIEFETFLTADGDVCCKRTK